MNETRIAGAVDIGGSKTIVGIVNSSGRILVKQQFPTSVSTDPEKNLRNCSQRLRQCLQAANLRESELCGIGVSAPGLVDSEKGILIVAPYAGWKDVAIHDFFKDEWPSMEIQVANDVNACASGESFFGRGQEYRHFLWVTISTGIGGALVVNEEIYYGEHNIAGEIGHFVVEWENGKQCGCGNKGCLEAHASGTAIARTAKERIAREGEQSELGAFFKEQNLEITAENIAFAVRHSVEEAVEIFQQAGAFIGRAFSYAANLLNPGAIIVGGGVSQSFDLLEANALQVMHSAVIGESNRSLPVIRTGLGYEAAFLGAASLVFSDFS